MYGKRKAIAKRIPLSPSGSNNKEEESSFNSLKASNLPLQPDDYMHIPAIPEGNMTTDTEEPEVGTPQKSKTLSQHDLLNKYFRRDALVLRNVDLLR